MFGRQGFHNEPEQEGFLHKALGIAKLTATVAAAMTLGRPLLSRIGKYVLPSVDQLVDNPFIRKSGIANVAASAKDLWSQVYSREAGAINDAADAFRKRLFTTFYGQKKTELALTRLEEYVTEDSLEAFHNQRAFFTRSLHPIAHASDRGDLENFLNSTTLQGFLDASAERNVRFKFAHGTAEASFVLESISRETIGLERRISGTEAQEWVMKYQDQIFEAISSAHKDQQHKSQKMAALFGFHPDDMVKFGDVDPSEHHQIESALEKLTKRRLAGVETENPIFDRSLKQTRSNLDFLFGSDMTDPESYRVKAEKLLMESSTGFARNDKGQLVPLGLFRTMREQVADKLINELQIPLLPPFMSARASLFKFGLPSNKIVRDVGTLFRSELTKGERPRIQNSPHSQGIVVGDYLTEINWTGDPEQSFIKFHSGFKVKTFDNRNSHIQDLQQIRGLEPLGFLDKVSKAAQTKNPLQVAAGIITEGDEVHFSMWDKLMSGMSRVGAWPWSTQVDVGRIPIPGTDDFVPTGFLSRPKPGMGPFFGKRFAERLGINPISGLEYLESNPWVFDEQAMAQDVLVLQREVVEEAANYRSDQSAVLLQMRDMIEENPQNFLIPDYIKSPVMGLLGGASDVNNIRTNLFDVISASDETLVEMTDILSKSTPGNFFGAVNRIDHHWMDLDHVGYGETGRLNNAVGAAFGHTGLSAPVYHLQEGLISLVAQARGHAHVARLAGDDGTGEVLLRLYEAAGSNINEVSTNPLIIRLQEMGLGPEGIAETLSKMFFPVPGGVELSEKAVGNIGVAILDPAEIFQLAHNDLNAQSKLLQHYVNSMSELEALPLSVRNRMIAKASEQAKLKQVLESRFNVFGKQYHPRELDINPMVTDSRQMVIGYDTDQPWFGRVVDYVSSQIDPDSPLTHLGMVTQVLGQMPQRMGEQVGLGLSAQDRYSSLRSLVGFWGKRVLPLAVGYEFYKNFNANMHEAGLPGFDDVGARGLANFNLLTAHIKDAFGVTNLFQNFAYGVPGMDQFFHPRTADEYKDYLFYGDEEVRRGRGWLVGSRTPIGGYDIRGVRPNFFRRWTSHWTEASNVQISDPAHSFLPNLFHPFAPLNALIDSGWWEREHRYDRPYVGAGAPNRALQSPDTFIETNSFGAYGALALGTFGGGYPTSMSGGGSPFALFSNPGGYGGAAGGGIGPGMGGGGDPIQMSLHKGRDLPMEEGFSLWKGVVDLVDVARTQTGLYGAFFQRFPLYPRDLSGSNYQSSSQVRSFGRQMWMNERGELGALGPIGEFYRRFIQPDYQSYDAYNPRPNLMPSWLPERFRHGDPYMRTFQGELNLPGEAYEKTHPWTRPLRVRGSSVGYTEEQLIEKWLNPTQPLESESAENIVAFGSEVHKRVQREMYRRGILMGAEVSIYDRENNISGTIDAIVRGVHGPEIVEIKTQGGKSWGKVPEEYVDQVTFYMAQTGIPVSHLVFVNRDNPNQIRRETVPFDQARMQQILGRISRARQAMEQMVENHQISPFETYDLLARIEILSRVAPDSPEFRKYVTFAENSGLGGFEKQRVDQAIETAEKLRQNHNLYPFRSGLTYETESLLVQGIGEDGSLVTESGVFRLAGVKWDHQAFAYEDPAEVMARYGIKIGNKIPITLMHGQFNSELMNDTVLPAVVGNVNRKLLDSQYAGPLKESRNPLDYQVVYGESTGRNFLEAVFHKDNFITNKLLHVRTALEQFERAEVFGTDRPGWDNLYGNYLKPTITSLLSKDPISAALQAGVAASFFVFSRKAKLKVASVAGGLAAAGSAVRGLYEVLTGNVWTPESYRDQIEFDEYWDTLEYLKQTGIAQRARKLAKEEEGTDIDSLEAQPTRQTVSLGPFAMLAIQAERKARKTMYGYDVSTGSLQDALATLPSRQREIAESVITTGGLAEKQRFYDLLGDSQRRVLGKFLNVPIDALPQPEKLTEYFKSHVVPDPTWEGWSPLVDTRDLRTRAAKLEAMQVERPSNSAHTQAIAATKDIDIPEMDMKTPGDIYRTLRKVLNGQGLGHIDVQFQVRKSQNYAVNVDLALVEDQTQELLEELRAQSRLS